MYARGTLVAVRSARLSFRVVRDDLQACEQLALVLVDALDLHDEHRVRVELDAAALLRSAAPGRACSRA